MQYALMRIKELRVALKNTSQTDMALDLGTTQATVSRMERGTQNATLEKLSDVAAYLGVTIPELFVQPEKPETARRLEELLCRCSAEQQEALLVLLESAASASSDNIPGSGPIR